MLYLICGLGLLQSLDIIGVLFRIYFKPGNLRIISLHLSCEISDLGIQLDISFCNFRDIQSINLGFHLIHFCLGFVQFLFHYFEMFLVNNIPAGKTYSRYPYIIMFLGFIIMKLLEFQFRVEVRLLPPMVLQVSFGVLQLFLQVLQFHYLGIPVCSHVFQCGSLITGIIGIDSGLDAGYLGGGGIHGIR